MQADKGDVKAADKKADGQQPEALSAKRLLQRILGALRNGSAGLGGRGTGSRNPKASGTITIDITPRTSIVVCQSSSGLQRRGERHDGELPE